ncbi:uncharacterized protein PG986_005048 [Apiospora aurea]|uniref:Uncharacterized protein n=1 Tax=Apiospora aurea TaxID=335848 RepID=A0ABR1QHX2_9PEZI
MKNIKMLVATLAMGFVGVNAAAQGIPTPPGFIGYANDGNGQDTVARPLQPSPGTILSEPPVVGGGRDGSQQQPHDGAVPSGFHIGLKQQQGGSTWMTTVTTTGTLTLTLASGSVTTISGPYAIETQVVESDTTIPITVAETASSQISSMTDADYGASSSSSLATTSTSTSAASTATITASTSTTQSSDASSSVTTPALLSSATTAASSSFDSSASESTASGTDDSATSTPDATSSDAASPSNSGDPNSAASHCTAMAMLQKFAVVYIVFQFWDTTFFDRYL